MTVLNKIVVRFGPKSLVSKRLWLAVIIPLGMILLAWVTVGDLATHPDNIPGIDTYWHITLIDEATDRFLAGEPMGPISETINAGLPYLYDTGSVYPEFVYWVSILVALASGGAGAAYGLLMFGAIAIAQMAFYYGFRSRLGSPGALIGSFAFAYAPFSLTAVAPEGRYPALLAVSTTPLVLAGVMSLIDRPTRTIWLVTVGAVLLSVAFHPMVFYIAAVPIGLIGFIFSLDLKVGPKRLAFAMSAIVIGVLVAWILLPDGISDMTNIGGQITAVSGDVGGRAAAGTASDIVPFSIRWNSFDTSLRLSNLNYAGLGLVLASLLTLVLVRRRMVVIFGLGTLLAYVLATGSLTPLWDQIPLAARLEPRRFLFPAYLGAGLVIASGVSFWIYQYQLNRTRRNLAIYGSLIVVVCGLLLFDVIPMVRRIAPIDHDQYQEWTSRINESGADIDGRLFWNSGSGFATYYFGGRETGLEVVGRLGTVDANLRSGYEESALSELALFNVRSVMTDEGAFRTLPPALEKYGFHEIGRWATRVLLASEFPGSTFMNQTVDVGLVGSASLPYWSKIFPNSVPISSPVDVRTEVLNSMKIIVLSGYSISDVERNENTLRDFVNRGGILIIEEPNRSGNNLFGISHTLEDVPRNFSVPSEDGTIDVIPFEIGGLTFRGVSYEESGELTVSGTTSDGETVRLVQKSRIGDGAIYWVCCNIGNHIVEANDRALGKIVYEYFESEVGGFRSIWPTEFDATVIRSGPSDFDITYSADENTPLLISLAGLSRRVMELETGEKIDLVPFGPIISTVLPAGSHTVSLSTQSQLVSIPATVIWLFGLGSAGLVLSAGWQPLTRVGGTYAGVVIESTRFMLRSLVRLAVPLWGGVIEFSGGSLNADSPRIAESFDVYINDKGILERYRSSNAELKLASVFVFVKSGKSEQLSFSVGDLRLSDGDGNVFEPFTGTGEKVEQTPEFELLSILGKRQNRLQGEFRLQSGESVSGHVLFEFGGSDHVGYLYIYGDPEKRIEFSKLDDSAI
ncbi:MAG: hypothetical protein HQ477_12465 [Chloroflexi bacterium]|nr:hypothetical protein [Chloroflexota bacterium]